MKSRPGFARIPAFPQKRARFVPFLKKHIVLSSPLVVIIHHLGHLAVLPPVRTGAKPADIVHPGSPIREADRPRLAGHPLPFVLVPIWTAPHHRHFVACPASGSGVVPVGPSPPPPPVAPPCSKFRHANSAAAEVRTGCLSFFALPRKRGCCSPTLPS